ncbi:hypothetical protein C8Q78DRAFT_1017911 [Trametes maxima]|nr:hypothetical protein C8Q78DRAFT_1017911 [Trametes maxima]
MSRRHVVPFLVAGVTGVLSGVYIFKPLFDDRNSNLAGPSENIPPLSTPNDATRQGSLTTTTPTQGHSSPKPALKPGVAPGDPAPSDRLNKQ